MTNEIDEDLRPLIAGVGVGALFQACFDVIDQQGPTVMTQGNYKLDLSEQFILSAAEEQNKFRGLASCELSLSEALSLCYLSEYVRERHYKYDDFEYTVAVQIERSFHHTRDHKLKEWYLGDGMLRWESKGGNWSALPVQETKAVNFTPHTDNRVIEDEVIRVITRKTSESTRKHYNNVCGLLVSVMPKASNIDYRRILENIDIASYDAAYLVEYSNGFKTGTVINLLSYKNANPEKPLTITPQLVRL